MSKYSYLEIFRRPLQAEELVRRVDVTGKKPDEKVSQIRILYECYPFKDYHIVLKGSIKPLELISNNHLRHSEGGTTEESQCNRLFVPQSDVAETNNQITSNH
jgi:hypothetical protein